MVHGPLQALVKQPAVFVIDVGFFESLAAGQEDLLHHFGTEMVVGFVSRILPLLGHLKDQSVGSSIQVIQDKLENK